jgi:hypothetical protein
MLRLHALALIARRERAVEIGGLLKLELQFSDAVLILAQDVALDGGDSFDALGGLSFSRSNSLCPEHGD